MKTHRGWLQRRKHLNMRWMRFLKINSYSFILNTTWSQRQWTRGTHRITTFSLKHYEEWVGGASSWEKDRNVTRSIVWPHSTHKMTQQILKESIKELKQANKTQVQPGHQRGDKVRRPAEFPTIAQLASETRGCLQLPLPELGQQQNADPQVPSFLGVRWWKREGESGECWTHTGRFLGRKGRGRVNQPRSPTPTITHLCPLEALLWSLDLGPGWGRRDRGRHWSVQHSGQRCLLEAEPQGRRLPAAAHPGSLSSPPFSGRKRREASGRLCSAWGPPIRCSTVRVAAVQALRRVQLFAVPGL